MSDRTLRPYGLAAFSMLCIMTGPALAQDRSVTATIYGWLPGMDAEIGTPLGTVDAEPSGGNVFDILEGVFMGTLEARLDRWALVADLIYVDLEATQETPFGLAFENASVETRATAGSIYGIYRVHDGPRLAFDIGGGLRALSLDIDTDLRSAGLVRDRSFGLGKDWIIPIVGARAIVPLSERWFATAYADVGNDFDDSSTWQGFASIGYRFTERWSAQLGYRHMSIEEEIGGFDIDIDLSGAQIGLSASF